MTIRAAEHIVPFWHTPESEKDKDNPTRFHLKPLDGVELFAVRSMIKFDAEGNLITSPECARTVLRTGLLGWENFVNTSGPVVFDAVERTRNLAHLDFNMVSELFSAIINRSTLTETARKN